MKNTDPKNELSVHARNFISDFSNAMEAKMLKAQQKYGFTDEWAKDNWEKECQEYLLNHIQKGDPVDVAIYCGFMWYHGWSTQDKK